MTEVGESPRKSFASSENDEVSHHAGHKAAFYTRPRLTVCFEDGMWPSASSASRGVPGDVSGMGGHRDLGTLVELLCLMAPATPSQKHY